MSAAIMDIFLNLEKSPLTMKKSSPKKKFVSIFRINGLPIIGPLMTEEKTLEMQSYKDKAIQLEQILSEKRLRKLPKRETHPNDRSREYDVYRCGDQTARSQLESSICTEISGEESSLSQEEYNIKCSEESNSHQNSERDVNSESYRNKASNTKEAGECVKQRTKRMVDCATNTDDVNAFDDGKQLKFEEIKRKLFERLKKLDKSDTVIYDNRNNSLMMSTDEMELEHEFRKLLQLEEQKEQQKSMEQRTPANIVQELVAKFSSSAQPKQRHSVCESRNQLERQIKVAKANSLNGSVNRESLHLPLSTQTPKPQYAAIPSICVNPPTPLVGPNNICDSQLSGSESADSFEYSHAAKVLATSPQPLKDSSSEEDRTELISTGEKLQSIVSESCSVEKSLRFEDSYDENETNKPCHVRRSFTSPALQSLSKKQAKTHMLTTSLNEKSSSAENLESSGLVRSNSFTLDTPSKALIDHMRQKQPGPQSANSNRKPIRRFGDSPSPSAMRDTVESKAKRVQKVDLKSRNPISGANKRNQKKAGANTFNTIPHRPSAAPVWGSANNGAFDKSKLSSPYTSSRPSSIAGKSLGARRTPIVPSKQKIAKKLVVKKSPSSTTYTKEPSPDLNESAVTPNSSFSSWDSSSTSNMSSCPVPSSPAPPETLQEIENRHRQKYLMLLAYQQEEQNRMQRAFEAQHKLLMEQLSSEMYRAGILTNSSSSTPSEASTLKNQPPVGKQLPQTSGPPAQECKMSPKSSLCFKSANVSLAANEALTAALSQKISSTTTTLVSCGVLPPSDTNLHYKEKPASAKDSPHAGISDGADNRGLPFQRRRILSYENVAIAPKSVEYAKNLINNNISPRRVEQGQPHDYRQDESQLRIAAATKLQAHARGFLVRRLFRTEQIQRIAQTIRDTLIFVLNLHMETIDDPEESNNPANITLKAQLLQQLTSTTRTLHLILFQTSTKERMEIIARDRKRIQTKLLAASLKKGSR